MLRVQSPYNVTKMDSVSVSQDSPASLAMNAQLALKGTNVTNVPQNFMDTQIAKVGIFRHFISYLKTILYLFEACECNDEGSKDKTCDKDGMCTCSANVDGDKCSGCSDGYYSFPECLGMKI